MDGQTVNAALKSRAREAFRSSKTILPAANADSAIGDRGVCHTERPTRARTQSPRNFSRISRRPKTSSFRRAAEFHRYGIQAVAGPPRGIQRRSSIAAERTRKRGRFEAGRARHRRLSAQGETPPCAVFERVNAARLAAPHPPTARSATHRANRTGPCWCE